MGNCQAAEAATVVIERPGGSSERLYWSVNASQIMAKNPGYYVAIIITARSKRNDQTSSSSPPLTTAKYLRLLRPDDLLLIGHVYRLVSFEDVLEEFRSKKHVKLSRLLAKENGRSDGKKESGRRGRESDDCGGGGGGDGDCRDGGDGGGSSTKYDFPTSVNEDEAEESEDDVLERSISRCRNGRWKPTLHPIAEFGG